MPSHRIFVGRVPVSVTTDEITARFAKFGKIIDAYIPHNPITRQSKGMAFISFDNEEAVEQALAHGKHMLGGELCEVKRADPKSDAGSGLPSVSAGALITIGGGGGGGGGGSGGGGHATSEYRAFVKGIPDNMTDDIVRLHFEKFGAVLDVYLPMAYGNVDGNVFFMSDYILI